MDPRLPPRVELAVRGRGDVRRHGLHPFRDPALHEEFSADRRAIDVSTWHRYAVGWRPDGVDFLLDGR